MRIKQQYLQEYLHDIAINQLTAEYQSKGYSVAVGKEVGGTEADLVATREGEVVVVEVKVGKMTPEKRERVTKLADYVKDRKNHKFLVVFSTPPKPKSIDIPNLDTLLFRYFKHTEFPGDVHDLSGRQELESVEDAAVDELVVLEEGGFHIKGNGTIGVIFRNGPPEDESVSYDSFPFTFEAILKQNKHNELVIDKMGQVNVDTSSYDES